MITLLTICAIVAGLTTIGIIAAMIIDFLRHGISSDVREW